MKLVDLITRETSVPRESVMLLRHGSNSVRHVIECGSTIEEFTAIQPVDSKYDFHHSVKPKIEIVVVIADNVIQGVYRVAGVEAEGTYHSLGSAAYRRFDAERIVDEPKRAVLRCRRFALIRLPSVSAERAVQGWERRERAPVQRVDGGFFDEIEIAVALEEVTDALARQKFELWCQAALKDSSSARLERLARAAPLPRQVELVTTVFVRNADVVAETLFRADGRCQECNRLAPFIRRADGQPYLEVHHRIPLADGGEDTVENAIALCPNCHRKAHFG